MPTAGRSERNVFGARNAEMSRRARMVTSTGMCRACTGRRPPKRATGHATKHPARKCRGSEKLRRAPLRSPPGWDGPPRRIGVVPRSDGGRDSQALESQRLDCANRPRN